MASPRGASRLSAESSVIVRLAHALDAEHIDAVHSRSSNVLDEIFEIVDGDHNGQITKDEFQQLFDAMKGHAKRELRVEKSLKDVASVATEEKVKATRRLKVAFCLGTVMFIFLLISVLLNFALSYHVVDSLVKTQPSSDGRLLTKDLDRPADVQVAQSGQDVMLGLLPFLPKVAPLAVLRASPEFAILHLGGLFNQSYRALRFEGAEFLPPARIRLFVAGGGLVDLEGGYTGTFTDTTGVVHEFCSACAPVQLKSLLNSVELEEADALFNEYLDDHYDNASLICQDPLRMQVSTGLSMMNKSLADTAGGPPLMCKVASDDDEADNRPSATFETVDGTSLRVDHLRVGDQIRTPSGFEPIVGFLHADQAKKTQFVRIDAGDGKHSMALSARHRLVVNGELTNAIDVKPGDVLTMSVPSSSGSGSGPVSVDRVHLVVEQGLYHPITPSGYYFVDGLLASSQYSYLQSGDQRDRFLWRFFFEKYAHWRYLAGVPVVPEGEGFFSSVWIFALLKGLGLSGEAITLLTPLTAPCVFLSEMANKLILGAAQALGGEQAGRAPLGGLSSSSVGMATTAVSLAALFAFRHK